MDKKISQFSNNAVLLDEDELIINKDLTTYKIQAGSIKNIDSDIIISTVVGPRTMVKDQTFVYKITNYDITLTYDIQQVRGTISVNRDLITYVAPSTPGVAGFIVNGRYFKVNIIDSIPTYKPRIVSPLANSTLTSQSFLFQIDEYLSSYEYNCEFLISDNEWVSTDWELATDILFNDLVASAYDSVTYINTWLITNLTPGATLYVRARYKGILNGYSDWSNPVKITTVNQFIPANETAIFLGDSAQSNRFGYSIAINDTGDRVVIGSPYEDVGGFSNSGAVYVFYYNGTNWIREQKISQSSKAADDLFGSSVAIDSTGNRIVIGAELKTSSGVSFCGVGYIFIRSGNTWTEEAILTANDKASSDKFGTKVAIDSTGTRVAIGAPFKTVSGASFAGAVYIFRRDTGPVWTQEAKIIDLDINSGERFGFSIALDASGSRIIISAPYKDYFFATDSGYVFSFVRNGTFWTQEQVILFTATAEASDRFGYSVDINPDSTLIAIGSIYRNSHRGSVTVYSKINNTWTNIATLTASDGSDGAWFGSSVSMDSTGNRIVVGSKFKYLPNEDIYDAGSIYLFIKTNNNWVEHSQFLNSDNAEGDIFGENTVICRNGSKIIGTSSMKTVNGFLEAGAAYLFS